MGTNMVHRAVRMNRILLPSNEKDFDVKLCDCWCILKMKKGKNAVVFDGSIHVDVTTCAPEVIYNGRWTDKADVWSCGCLLFELLSWHPPYGGGGRALSQWVMNILPEFDNYCGKVSGTMLLKQFEKTLFSPKNCSMWKGRQFGGHYIELLAFDGNLIATLEFDWAMAIYLAINCNLIEQWKWL